MDFVIACVFGIPIIWAIILFVAVVFERPPEPWKKRKK